MMDTLQQPNLESPAEAIQLLPLSLKNRRLLGAAFLAAMLLSLALPLTANADPAAPKRQFHIPAGTLSDALLQFSETSDQKVLFNADLVQGFRTEGLDGSYTSGQALQRLLDGSGLSARETATGSITLEKRPRLIKVDDTSQSDKQLPIDDTTLPKVTVEADASYDPDWAKDPYNPDYVLPNATSGTKTDTPIMETPLNVQVISKQVLKDQQVIRLEKALRNVSGVTILDNTYPSGSGIFLRGFESTTTFRNGFRLNDGVSSGQQQGLANIESIEVLKGPAAILYGRVEPGGMVNIVTKQPLATPYYSLNQQFGSYDLYRTSVDATGPVTKDDSLLYRMNLSYENSGSFRDFIGKDNVLFAPSFKWNISPRTQATLEVVYDHNNASSDNGGVEPLTNNGKVLDILHHNLNLFSPTPTTSDDILVGLNWSHQFNDGWSIKHQMLFDSLEYKSSVTALNSFDPDTLRMKRETRNARFVQDTYATILDLTGHFDTFGLKHTLLLGGDYYRVNYHEKESSAQFPTSEINILDPYNVMPLTPTGTFNVPSTIETDNYGLYLQDQIELPFHVHVTGGLRYQYVHRTNSDIDLQTNTPTTYDPQTDDAVTPRVGLLWQPQKWLSLYSNYVENFGANTGRGYLNKPLPPQSAQQWEIGAKTEFFDGRFRATLAYYDLTKQNVATTDTNPTHTCFGGGFGSCSIAIGEVRSRGPELDIQGEILPGWNVIATYANQDVRITKNNATLETDPTSLVGNRLQFVPRNVGSFWSTYEVQQGDLKGFKFGGGVTLQDSVVDAGNKLKSPGYALVGLMTGYSFEVGKSKITAQLNIDNLLDKTYFTNVGSYNGLGFGNFSTPRTFLGSINVQY